MTRGMPVDPSGFAHRGVHLIVSGVRGGGRYCVVTDQEDTRSAFATAALCSRWL